MKTDYRIKLIKKSIENLDSLLAALRIGCINDDVLQGVLEQIGHDLNQVVIAERKPLGGWQVETLSRVKLQGYDFGTGPFPVDTIDGETGNVYVSLLVPYPGDDTGDGKEHLVEIERDNIKPREACAMEGAAR